VYLGNDGSYTPISCHSPDSSTTRWGLYSAAIPSLLLFYSYSRNHAQPISPGAHVPADHRWLTETFDYEPQTLEMEAQRWFLGDTREESASNFLEKKPQESACFVIKKCVLRF
jgi:hypothetical protein